MSDLGQLLPPPRTPSLARRIRISLEHHLLSCSNLLDQVAHVDPTPSDQVVLEVKNAEPKPMEDSVVCSAPDSDTRYPVFVRFKTKMAACQLIEFIKQSCIEDGSQKPVLSCVRARLLSSKSEVAYCRAVAASLVGSHERRRRIQQNRRQRMRNQKDGKGSTEVEPMDSSSSTVSSRITSFGGDNSAGSASTSKHIIFDA
ncbi:unnamed protein product [Echinostoma caproni]|uniref:PID domain-containing protein n=1 Tax=Echinostoma caproni TaxID=27848 RepID=A0A183BD23_9TREM|nr:unnamed protein product [Echinostoma caproni]